MKGGRKETSFDDSPDSTHNLVVGLVPPGARVLEFGCATGHLSQVLSKRLRCRVTGIERSPEAAALARRHCERVITGDAESQDFAEAFGADRFDAVVFADVLEQLRDPAAVLRRIRPFLAEKGMVVASIRNLTHVGARLALLVGEVPYRDPTPLDQGYARLFTREGVQDLFEGAGYAITEWLPNKVEIDLAEVQRSARPMPPQVREWLAADPDGMTYEFIVRAAPADAPELLQTIRRELRRLRNQVEERDATIRELEERTARAQGVVESLAQQVGPMGNPKQLSSAQEDLGSRLREGHERLEHRLGETQAMLSALQASVQEVLKRQGSGDGAAEHASAESERPPGDLPRRLQEVVRTTVPASATLLVMTKADENLPRFDARVAWSFPRTANAAHGNDYPQNSTSAIAHLEALRAAGADFLLIPATAAGWLEHYLDFRRHLDRRYRLIAREQETCWLYSLRQGPRSAQAAALAEFEELLSEYENGFDSEPAVLDWHSGLELSGNFPHLSVITPATGGTLPYLDRTIDIVALASNNRGVLEEARRVAKTAVACFRPEHTSPLTVEFPHGTPRAEPASVSIIIAAYNGIAHTEACLHALGETLPRWFRGEIIVVDDASTDGTSARLKDMAAHDKRLRVLRNGKNQGFLASVNRGARAASGDILVFLNNDTISLPGWLPPLLRLFRTDPQAGVVGAKLIFPDGSLQEAGAVVFADGSAAKFGYRDCDVEVPLYNYVREVDYCSGAVLVTPRALFRRLRGFDMRYAPGFYEDADYCFRVRQAGYRVYYQPESHVVHVEGATAGTDLATGPKRYQALNQSKFVEKWAEVLQQQPIRPLVLDFSAWAGLAGRQRRNGGGSR